MQQSNLFAGLPESLPEEVIDTIVATAEVRIERIVSTGQSSPPESWYDQEEQEWVVLLQGAARLSFEERHDPVTLHAGDYVLIPRHCRHRVEWTSPDEATVWLAVFFPG